VPRPTGSAVLPPDRAGSPGSLIVSFAGSYLRELGGWIAVADLIRCLKTIGLVEPAIRQALVRLKSRGFLDAERRSGEAGYLLTEAGRHDLSTGDRRIFRPAAATPEDGWVLAVFSVPETERHLRHQLRTELSWLGFGTVSPGVWIAPRPLADPTRALLTDAGLDGYVTWFGAQHLTEIDVAAWWDLDSLRAQYESFLTDHRPVIPAPDAAEPDVVTDEHAFASYLRLLDAWRLFPRLDPGLPASLLPADWPARAAWELFDGLRGNWSAAGLRYVRAVTGR
jgi:phenylacetic acid degradation operon negative regulatory protein